MSVHTDLALDGETSKHADELFQQKHFEVCRATDRLFAGLMIIQWIGGIVVAMVVSPNTWIGTTSEVHIHVWAAVLLGGAICSLPVFLGFKAPGFQVTRNVIAAAQVLWVSLLIHLTGGRIETHFYIFVSFAFLSFYREWRLLIIPTALAAVDHIVRGIWWPQSIYGVFANSSYRWIEHAGWLLFEVVILAYCCRRNISEMHESCERQSQVEAARHNIEKRVQQRTSQLASSEARLRSSETRLQKMLDSMPDPMITINSCGIIQATNSSVATCLGWADDELVGQHVRELLPQVFDSPHDGNTTEETIPRESIHLDKHRELVAKRSNGEEFPVTVTFWQVDLPDDPERILMGTVQDISERKRNEAELETLNKMLVNSAREAGKSEIATSVLHNVGNVLNSVNVAARIIEDRIRQSNVTKLNRAVAIMNDHLDGLGNYLTQHERGKHLPKFLTELGQQMVDDEATILEEVETLVGYIDHINTIVVTQQEFAKGVTGVLEKVLLADVLEDAICINKASMQRHSVDVILRCDELPPIFVDKQKILQIAVNLISNAKYACLESSAATVQVVVSLRRSGENRASIEVRDNGIGIVAENLTRIFAYGFTTRKEGHGFGLHSAALTAEELGGHLSVRSDGAGTGSTFTLEFPYDEAGVALCTT